VLEWSLGFCRSLFIPLGSNITYYLVLSWAKLDPRMNFQTEFLGLNLIMCFISLSMVPGRQHKMFLYFMYKSALLSYSKDLEPFVCKLATVVIIVICITWCHLRQQYCKSDRYCTFEIHIFVAFLLWLLYTCCLLNLCESIVWWLITPRRIKFVTTCLGLSWLFHHGPGV